MTRKVTRHRRTVITPEEKARWKPILQGVWDGIAYDVLMMMPRKTCRRSDVVEFACDAGRPCEDHGFGGQTMTQEEYRVLGQWYGSSSFKKWMREEVFPSSDYCI